MSSRALALSLTLLLVASVAAGCGVNTNQSAALASPTPSQSGSPTAVESPTPTATATPTAAPGTCSFIWSTAYNDGTVDFYEVDIDKTAWNASTTSLDGTLAIAYLVTFYDPSNGSFQFAAATTAGAITLGVSGMNMGDAASFNDAGGHTFFDATDYFSGASTSLGGPVGTGGLGSFTGNLSNPDPNTAATAGTGNVSATDSGGTSETFGGDASPALDFAVCST